MASEVEFWRQDPAPKAEGIAQDVERLSRRARFALSGPGAARFVDLIVSRPVERHRVVDPGRTRHP
jgi:hypothetical protein